MNLCSDDHDEVCYEGKDCPVCKAISETNEEKDINNGLLDEIKDLKAEVKDMEAKLPS
jgi:hypothetical protein